MEIPDAIGAALVGALASAVVNGIFNWVLKKRELETRELEIAVKLIEMQDAQVDMIMRWEKDAVSRSAALTSPMLLMPKYLKAVKQLRRHGSFPEAVAHDTQRQAEKAMGERLSGPGESANNASWDTVERIKKKGLGMADIARMTKRRRSDPEEGE